MYTIIYFVMWLFLKKVTLENISQQDFHMKCHLVYSIMKHRLHLFVSKNLLGMFCEIQN